MPTVLTYLPLLAPLVFGVVALSALRAPGRRPAALLARAEGAALVALAAGAGTLLALAMGGAATSPLIGAGGVGLSARIDILSAVLLALVALLGWVVTRYAATYLDGEARQGAFTGWLAATLAGVTLMVTAGNLVQLVLGWVGMSLALHRLLVFYPERRQARLAAAKKAAVARGSDLALIGAATILWAAFGTSDIAAIGAAVEAGERPGGLGWAAALLALAAVLKSAQVPLHGWLVDVMETPTPVSALLHAGIVNAGGMLALRFADVLLAAPGVLVALGLIGGLTALWGSLVMLTQPAVKTALAWSTVGQMGFMLLQIGLALFPMALVHIVAHSLYKAHAFLSSGGAVAQVKAARRVAPAAPAEPGRLLAALGGAGAVYLALAGTLGAAAGAAPQTLGLGAVMALGLLPLLVPALAQGAPAGLPLRLGTATLGVAVLYVALHGAAAALAGDMLPKAPVATPGQIGVLVLAMAGFGTVALAQASLPLWAGAPRARRLRFHLANGLYAGAVLHRAAGGFARPSA